MFGKLEEKSYDYKIFDLLLSSQGQELGDYGQNLVTRMLEQSGVIPSMEQLEKFGDGRVKVQTSILAFNFDQTATKLEDFRGKLLPVHGVMVSSKQINVNEFDDFLEEQVLQPNSQCEYWYDLTINNYKSHTLTGDEIRLALSDLPDSKMWNTNAQEVRQAIAQLKTEIGLDESEKLTVDDLPITVQIIANVSGVKRLLFQTTIILAAT